MRGRRRRETWAQRQGYGAGWGNGCAIMAVLFAYSAIWALMMVCSVGVASRACCSTGAAFSGVGAAGCGCSPLGQQRPAPSLFPAVTITAGDSQLGVVWWQYLPTWEHG